MASLRTISWDASHLEIIRKLSEELGVSFDAATFALIELAMMTLNIVNEAEGKQVEMLSKITQDDAFKKMAQTMKSLKSQEAK